MVCLAAPSGRGRVKVNIIELLTKKRTSNPHSQGIRPAEIRRLFPNCRFQFQRITLAPPLARRLAPLSWLLAALLEKLRLFNTHYLVAIQPPS